LFFHILFGKLLRKLTHENGRSHLNGATANRIGKAESG
jgi:hypothetical protein